MLLCGLGYYCNRYLLENKLKDQALREIKDDTEKRLTWTRELLSMLCVMNSEPLTFVLSSSSTALIRP